jgi:DNA repair/transcription protein MET18/MMS19
VCAAEGWFYHRLAGNFKSKSHVQSTRHIVFLLVDALLAKHLSAMKTLGDEFVSGYIKLAEGEKDPRNLILAFGIGRVILIEFDPYKHLDVSLFRGSSAGPGSN